ncbi:MAG: DNA/RNA non-specific endonuclease [Sphingobium sp.]|nr:DNA/RNA non-specific endonuclease [Sphingobium sp.]
MASAPNDASIAEESRSRLSQLPGDMRAAAQRALAKGLFDAQAFDLVGHEVTSPLQTVGNPVGLEAIVLLAGRPPMLVRNNKVVIDAIAQNAMGPGTGLPTLNAGKISAIEGFMPSIGRVEFTNHRLQWGGTGWVIEGAKTPDKRWIVTNRHVAKYIGQRIADGSGVFLRSPAGAPYGAKVDMGEEYGGPANANALECKVERIVFLADDTEADCSLFEIVVTATCKPGVLPLASKRAAQGELVATVGYPAYDSRNEEAPMRKYFGDIYNVKRFAPGLIMQSDPGLLLMHDCTTLGGNSGSPLISLDQKAIVGLHFSGTFASGNSAVSVETLKQLQTGKLFAVTAKPAGQEAVAETPPDGEHQASDLANRSGFSTGFLGKGLKVSLPRMTKAIVADLATPSDATAARKHELRYTHFGAFFSKSRRTPRFTAVNIDGAKSVHVKRADDDIWFFDLRIDRELQLGKALFPGDLDRGHMVRREDPNWGKVAQQANDDTFHYTNCALQHSALNRGKTMWQGLENYILESARTEGFKACVFTGPILADDDPPLGLEDVLIPREFWKVVVMPKAGGAGLHATGYLLSQGDLIRKLLEERGAAGRGANEAPSEGFELGAYRTFQIAIRHIEQATCLNWPGLKGADPLEAAGNEAISPVIYTPLESGSDIVL